MKEELRQIELLEMESSQRQHDQMLLNSEMQANIYENAIYERFNILKPRMYKDGKAWCVNSGEVDEQDFIGFGKTPHEAILKWYDTFKQEIK